MMLIALSTWYMYIELQLYVQVPGRLVFDVQAGSAASPALAGDTLEDVDVACQGIQSD